jgi:hypothetical protein
MTTEDQKKTIRTDVPLDLSPSILTALHSPTMTEGPGRALLAAGVGAFAKIYETLAALTDARRAALAEGTPNRTERGHVVASEPVVMTAEAKAKLASACDRAHERVTASVEAAVKTMAEHRTEIRRRIDDKFLHPERTNASVAMAGETREFVRGLPKTSRLNVVLAAVHNGDMRMISAIMGAPPYLSGLDGAQIMLVEDAAAKATCPALWAQLKSSDRIIAQVGAGRDSFERHFRKMRPVAAKRSDDAISRLAAGVS